MLERDGVYTGKGQCTLGRDSLYYTIKLTALTSLSKS